MKILTTDDRIYGILLDDDRILTLTADHRCLVKTVDQQFKWRTVGELKEGDILLSNLKLEEHK